MKDIVFGLKERGGFSRYQDDRIETYPSNGMIFITTSDIGFEKMKNLLLAYKNRSYIPQDKLRAEVRIYYLFTTYRFISIFKTLLIN